MSGGFRFARIVACSGYLRYYFLFVLKICIFVYTAVYASGVNRNSNFLRNSK